MKSTNLLSRTCIAMVLMTLATTAIAQNQLIRTLKVADGTVNQNQSPDALIDMQSTTKGLLLPRVELTSTTVAAPLANHTAGMVVYNTVSAGSGGTAVSPGYYYNDGTQWVKAYSLPSNGSNGQLLTSNGNNNASWGNFIAGFSMTPTYDVTAARTNIGSIITKFAHATLQPGKYMISYTVFFGYTSAVAGECISFLTLNNDPQGKSLTTLQPDIISGSFGLRSVSSGGWMPNQLCINSTLLVNITSESTLYLAVRGNSAYSYFLNGVTYTNITAKEYTSSLNIMTL